MCLWEKASYGDNGVVIKDSLGFTLYFIVLILTDYNFGISWMINLYFTIFDLLLFHNIGQLII